MISALAGPIENRNCTGGFREDEVAAGGIPFNCGDARTDRGKHTRSSAQDILKTLRGNAWDGECRERYSNGYGR